MLHDLGFSSSAIGLLNKGLGLPTAVGGTLLGGWAVNKIGMKRSLLIFGVLQAAPNLLYGLQYQMGANHKLLAIVISVDNFCNGLATAAIVVYMMALCDKRFTAFQYAALSSATGLLGRFVSGWSGIFVEDQGWVVFFVVTALASLPALLILLFLPQDAGMPEENELVLE
jgi:PAT family beta-lactamase induction signal transducer AmpG